MQWVNELFLTAHDREILLAPTGMLSDKHVDAAMTLLSGQFPKTSGLQSSLKFQFRLGFRPIDLDKRSKVQGELSLKIELVMKYNFFRIADTVCARTSSLDPDKLH